LHQTNAITRQQGEIIRIPRPFKFGLQIGMTLLAGGDLLAHVSYVLVCFLKPRQALEIPDHEDRTQRDEQQDQESRVTPALYIG
jgi:hypothetical protein